MPDPSTCSGRDLPTGTVTFLYTDIEGSAPLWEREPSQMRMALARHDAILRAAILERGGHVYKNIGDAFQAAFALPAQAVEAALVAQRRLSAETWPTSTPIRVRMGLHIGPAEAQMIMPKRARGLKRLFRYFGRRWRRSTSRSS